MHDTPIHREAREGVVTLRLNQPERMNPVSLPVQRALLAELAALNGDRSVRCLVLTGSGRAFCVGADLGEMGSVLAPGSESPVSAGTWAQDVMDEFTNPLLLAIRALPVPVVCAVNGAAAGGGVGLALAADIVLMARSAYFYLPFAPRLGILPDMGSTWWLPRLAGRGRAMGAGLLDQRISAAQAVDWGLAWAAFDDDQLSVETGKIAQRLAALAPGIALKLREAYQHAERNDFAGQLAYERLHQGPLIDTPAFAEGVQAFLEKRAPVFGS